MYNIILGPLQPTGRKDAVMMDFLFIVLYYLYTKDVIVRNIFHNVR